jgi:hypothetical protein
MWHKARAQSSQGVAGRPHHLGRLAMCWRISKNYFVYVSSRGGAQGIQCPKAVQGGNLAARPSCTADRPEKWASRTQSLARAPPYSSYIYHGPPPIEGVKKVRIIPPPKGLPNSIFVESRERRGSEGRRTSWLVGSPWSSSSVEALSESIWVQWSFLSPGSVKCESCAEIL